MISSPLSEIIDPFAPDKKRFLVKAEHLLRYEFANNYIRKLWKEVEVIYDVGCGTGYGVDILKETGTRVYGFDKQKLCENGYIIDFDQQSLSDYVKIKKIKLPNVVVCFELIEHLDSPIMFIKDINKLLLTDGILICSIPQARYDYPRKSFKRYHKHQFSIIKMLELLVSSGFVVEKIYGQPVSNIFVDRLKFLSHFINKVAYLNKSIFNLLKYLSFPLTYFYQYSYSIIFICRKKTMT